MQIWKWNKEGTGLVKSRFMAFPPRRTTLQELLLGHLKKNDGRGQYWIVFTEKEEGAIRKMISPFFPKTIPTSEILNALLSPVRKIWAGPLTATYITKSGILDGTPTFLAIMID